jgi:hypothetical protein
MSTLTHHAEPIAIMAPNWQFPQVPAYSDGIDRFVLSLLVAFAAPAWADRRSDAKAQVGFGIDLAPRDRAA